MTGRDDFAEAYERVLDGVADDYKKVARGQRKATIRPLEGAKRTPGERLIWAADVLSGRNTEAVFDELEARFPPKGKDGLLVPRRLVEDIIEAAREAD